MLCNPLLGGHVWCPILDKKEEHFFNICINSKNIIYLYIEVFHI